MFIVTEHGSNGTIGVVAYKHANPTFDQRPYVTHKFWYKGGRATLNAGNYNLHTSRTAQDNAVRRSLGLVPA